MDSRFKWIDAVRERKKKKIRKTSRRPESIRKQRERESSGMEKEEEEREKKSNLICMLPENPDRAECSLSARSNGREDVIFKRGGGGWLILPPSQMENVAVEKKAINTLCM